MSLFSRNREVRAWDEPDESNQMAELASIADDIEAGRIELPPRWHLDRPSPDVQVWTVPSGRRFACNPAGGLLPLPDGDY